MLKREKWKSAYLEALNKYLSLMILNLNKNFSLMILNLKVYEQTIILT